MKNDTGSKKMALAALVVTLAGILVATPASAAYPAQGDDVTPSIGILILWVEDTPAAFRSFVNNEQGWNADCPNCWTSAVLQDPTTRIGRSSPFPDGTEPAAGVPTGTAGTLVNDSFAFVPTSGFTDGPANTQEIHTEIWKMQLQGTTCPCGFQTPAVITVRAGIGAGVPVSSAFGVRKSWGEVEDLPGGGPDYPGESFFNVFAEIDTPFGTLYNPATDPLVIVNSNVLVLPPTVSYIHGETNSVPVYFKDGIYAGQRFGYLRLAGHKLNTFCGGIGIAETMVGDEDCTGIISETCSTI